MGLPNYRVENYDEENNAEQMMVELDLVKEKRELALICTTVCNQVITKNYNKRFQPRTFKVGDLVLKF